jgi:crossover junction endodeoxyribonuclease RuvC
MSDILALDIATTTGWARGRIDETPTAGSMSFGRPGATNNQIFGNALKWISQLLEPHPRPDIVIVEAMLPMNAMTGETNRATRDRLGGLHGVIRGVAHLRSIGEIAQASVGDVRQHFLGTRTLRSSQAKIQTVEQCVRLGWVASDDNAADALALWSYARSMIDPKYALVVSPMFNKQLRVRLSA